MNSQKCSIVFFVLSLFTFILATLADQLESSPPQTHLNLTVFAEKIFQTVDSFEKITTTPLTIKYAPSNNRKKIKENKIKLKESSAERSSKEQSSQCNPETNIYPCGSLEFIGCSGSKKFYVESLIRLNWFEAWEYCRSHDMHLASVETRYEQSFLEIFLPRSEQSPKASYWLSGTDLGREGLFIWMGSGKAFTYTNWQRSEPNNNRPGEHCLLMESDAGVFEKFKWNDAVCTAVALPICQKEFRHEAESPNSPSVSQLPAPSQDHVLVPINGKLRTKTKSKLKTPIIY